MELTNEILAELIEKAIRRKTVKAKPVPMTAKMAPMKTRCATCGDLAGWGTHPQCDRMKGRLLVWKKEN